MARGDEGRLVEVVLVEDTEPPSDAPQTTPTPAPGAPVPTTAPMIRSREGVGRRRGAVAGSLVLVVAVMAGIDARADRREREALAAYADVPGVVGSLAEPPREAWRMAGYPPMVSVGDVVVTADDGEVVGLDVTTGERRWTLQRPEEAFLPGCLPPVRDDQSRVLCGGFQPEEGGIGRDGLVLLDPASGALRPGPDGPDEDGPAVGYAAVGDGVLVLRRGDGGGPTATLHGLDPADERWSVPLGRVGAGWLAFFRAHGDDRRVALESATTVVLDVRDGHEIGRWSAASDGVTPAVARVVSHPGAGFGVWQSRFAGRWYTEDGSPGPALTGEPVEPEIDDGDTSGVVLLGSAAGDRLHAVDVPSGDVLWDRPAPEHVLLLLGGRLVVDAGGRLEAWDARTGTVEWSVPLDTGEAPVLAGPYTDGVRIAVRRGGDEGLELSAYRLTDGARVWRAPLPVGMEKLEVVANRLVAVGRFDDPRQSAIVLE